MQVKTTVYKVFNVETISKKDFHIIFFPGDLLGHVAEVHIHPQGIHVLAAVTATLAHAVAPLASHQAHSPSKPVLLLNSVSRKRLKLQKQLPRPRTPATHLLQPRDPHLLTSPAPSPITHPERAAPPLPHNQRKVLELPHQASLSPPPTSHPRGPLTTRPAGTEMERGKMTLCIGIKGKHQHLDRAKTRNEPLFHSTQLWHLYLCPKQFLSTQIKEKGMGVFLCQLN